MLRVEGAGGMVLCGQPFDRIMYDRPFHQLGPTFSHGENFVLAFFSRATETDEDRVASALATVSVITAEIIPLLGVLPKPVRERLHLPDSDNWWRILFHLGWHFPRPFLRLNRCRMLAKDGKVQAIRDETFVQLYGTGGLNDLFPGLIYSAMEHDLCTCSETAVGIIMESLERERGASDPIQSRVMSAETRRTFDRLRMEFLAGTQIPTHLECKLLKMADSFESPPATEWASLEVGGCAERLLTLSRLNAMQEIAQIRGPATDWFCQVAGRAGHALPDFIEDCPILFDDQRGWSVSTPVMNRTPPERWLGFVFGILKRKQNDALHIHWGTNQGPLNYGFAILDRDLCSASVLAIDLAGLTTAAEEAARQQRASCSPFSVPSMEDEGLHLAGKPPPVSPPGDYTLRKLINDLRTFGERYYQYADQIRQDVHPRIQRGAQGELGIFASQTRAYFQSIPGFLQLREAVQSLWKMDLNFVVGQRICDVLVRASRGSLPVSAVEALTLSEVARRLVLTLDPDEIQVSVQANPQGGTAEPLGDPTQPLSKGSSVLNVERWDDLGIGIDEDSRLLAFVPRPANGDVVRISDGVQLDLRGNRWQKVLDLLARSSDGRTAQIADLITKLGYREKYGLPVSRDQAEHDEHLTRPAKKAKTTLTGTMADLGRELRVLVSTEDLGVVFSEEDMAYRAAFITGHLLRDENRAIQFCWGRSAG
jgi:hypothetical protein